MNTSVNISSSQEGGDVTDVEASMSEVVVEMVGTDANNDVHAQEFAQLQQMDTSVNIACSQEGGGMEASMAGVVVEMVEADVNDDDDVHPQEYAELQQMQPMLETIDDPAFNAAEYSSLSAVLCQEESGDEDEGQTIYFEEPEPEQIVEDEAEQEDEMEADPKPDPKEQEEMISRLMSEDMTFSEITAMFGEDANSDDDEPTLPAPQEEKIDAAAAFENELVAQQSFHLKMKPKGRRRKKKMASALMCLMGQANLRCAQGNHDEAINMCMEVIRQCPTAPDPYHLLGMIYEDKKMVKKSLQFILTAAFLSPNAEEWERLSELCLSKTNDPKMAIFCLGRAIKANPQNMDNHLLRGKLLESIGERTKAEKGYCNALKYLGDDQGEEALILAKEIVKCHYKDNNVHLAREAMETAFRKYPSLVTAEDVNLMLELLLHQKDHAKCLEILVTHCGVVLLPKSGKDKSIKEQVKTCTSCKVPTEMKVDLTSKLAVSLIQLGVFKAAEPLVKQLVLEPTEEYGDLYLDVSEAYMDMNKHSLALPILEQLLKTPQYGEAAVWLQYAECLAAQSNIEAAINAYQKVVALAPQHADARLSLSSLLKSEGQQETAMRVLMQDSDSFPIDIQVLYKRCLLLLEQNLEDEFIVAVKLFFCQHFVNIRSLNEAEVMLNNKKITNKLESLRELRKSQNEPLEESSPTFIGSEVSVDEQWQLFLTLCNLLHEKKRFEELQRVTISALGSREFMKDKDRCREIEFLALLACIYNNDSYFAFNFVRETVIKNSTSSNRCWNLLNLVISKADDFRHNRFLLRLTHKNPDSLALGLLNGHNCLVAGTYKYALAEYTQAFRQDQNNPLIPLMLGLTYTHMACQKFSGKKHSLVVQACAFLNTYIELRGECQESYYNIGRSMHQLNLLPQAIFYYNKALKCPPVAEDSIYDLTREIAFNLSLIYKNSGNQNMANMYIYKYITV